MSDELLEDGRDLRKRKQRRDEEAEAAQNEVRVPLPHARNPADQPSGPYVVLEPPTEAHEPVSEAPSADAWLDSEVGQPAQNAPAPPVEEPATPAIIKSHPEYMPHFHTPTIELPRVPEEPAEPPAPRPIEPPPPRPDPRADYIPRFQTPTVELPAVHDEPPPEEGPSATQPDQIMKMPRITIEDEAEHPTHDPEPTRAGEPTFPKSPRMFYPEEETPGSRELPPVVVTEAVISPYDEIVTGEFIETEGEQLHTADFEQRLRAVRADMRAHREASADHERAPIAFSAEQLAELWRSYSWVVWSVVGAIGVAIAVLLIFRGGSILRGGGSPPIAPTRGNNSLGGGPSGSTSGDGLPAQNFTPTAAYTVTPLPAYAQGRLAFVSNRDGDFEVFVRVLATSVETQIIHNTDADRSPAWSPNGKRIAFTSNSAGTDDIWVVDADGQNLIQVTTSPAADHIPSWSPDGKSIVFSREDATGASLARIDTSCIDASNPGACEGTIKLITYNHYDIDPAWSPDGTKIVYAAGDAPGSPQKLVLTDPEGAAFIALNGTGSSDFSPIWSSDGTKIAFVSYSKGDDDIWMMSAGGTELVQITENESIDAGPAWSPDGAWLAFASDRGPAGDFDIYLIGATCAAPDQGCESAARPLTTDPGDDLDPVWIP